MPPLIYYNLNPHTQNTDDGTLHALDRALRRLAGAETEAEAEAEARTGTGAGAEENGAAPACRARAASDNSVVSLDASSPTSSPPAARADPPPPLTSSEHSKFVTQQAESEREARMSAKAELLARARARVDARMSIRAHAAELGVPRAHARKAEHRAAEIADVQVRPLPCFPASTSQCAYHLSVRPVRP